jgi:hypothetical protein
MDLFLPHPLSSPSRAKAFLWLVFHYYQGPQAPNPFADEYAQKNPGKMPRIQRLTEEEMKTENVDLSEEVEWAKRKSAQRSIILRDLIETEELEKKAKGKPSPLPNGPKGFLNAPRIFGDLLIILSQLNMRGQTANGLLRRQRNSERILDIILQPTILPRQQVCRTELVMQHLHIQIIMNRILLAGTRTQATRAEVRDFQGPN